MATENSLFHFEEDRKSFEDLAQTNGSNWWLEVDVMESLDYQNRETFRKVMMKAQQACLSLNIPVEDNFVRDQDGSYRFTRFACYLIAMNGSPKKPQVAAAQIYFAALAETYQSHLEHTEGIDRIVIRDEVADGEKSLSSSASQHGVTNYGFFKNAGYRGMYNMNLTRIRTVKGLSSKEKLIDRMGKEELAAHLFRITQTTAKINQDGLVGQKNLENTAFNVGRRVRQTMKEISGKTPESLPAAEPMDEVRKKIKNTNKQFKKIDKKS